MSDTALDVRPRRIRWVVVLIALVLLGLFTTVGVLLRRTSTGANFAVSDQVSIVLLGVLFAAGALLLARPRVRADESGVTVRNVLMTRRVEWEQVQRISYPDGSPWPRLELPDDEYVSVVAIQSVDGPHAVQAVRTLRELYRRHSSQHQSTQHHSPQHEGGG